VTNLKTDHAKAQRRKGWSVSDAARRFYRWAWLAVPLLALPLLWAFLTRGLPQSADGALHLLRLVVLDSHIAAGVLYPRWAPELFLGFGYPVFSFYGPVSYYLAEGLHLLGLGHGFALVGAFVVFILLAGLGMYLIARDVAQATLRRGVTVAALVAATAYMATPYLLTNAYLRGALGEVGAQALLPWIFWSFRRLVCDPRPARFVLPAALSLGGLAATHNITLLFAPPVLLVYLAVLAWPRQPTIHNSPTRGEGRGARGDANFTVHNSPTGGEGRGATSTSQFTIHNSQFIIHNSPTGSEGRGARGAVRSFLRRLAWPVVGGLAAVGVSAFFWLPLVAERQFLSSVAFDIAATYVLENIWTGQNFLDLSLRFDYTLSIPFQVGLVQLLLGVAGWALWPRRDREWWFWGVTGLLAGLGISQLAAPLWLGSDLLLIAQFPWRLLTIVSLPLALFAGGGLLRIDRPALRWVATVALLTLILWANRVDGSLLKPLVADNRNLDLPQVTQFELDTAAYGTSSASEFMPRWAADGLFAPRAPVTAALPSSPLTLTVTAAGPLALTAQIDAALPTPLEFTTFYFPGWTVTLDGAPLAARPSADRGLLTVDIPAGEHVLVVAWTGTPVQQWAGWISLATLALLAGWLVVGDWVHAKTPRRKGSPPPARSAELTSKPRPSPLLAFIPAALLLFGLVAMVRGSDASVTPVSAVGGAVQPGLRLLGLRTQARADGRLHLFPYWQVQGVLPSLRLRWHVLGGDGAVLAQTTVEPYFNALAAPLVGSIQTPPPVTLVDDAVTLALPPDLPAGSYALTVQAVAEDGAASAPLAAGMFELPGGDTLPTAPAHAAGARFGEALTLTGYDVTQNGAAPVLHNGRYLLAQPGDRLAYTLAWNGDDAAAVNYHSFLHLVDQAQRTLAQSDQLPGPVFSPPRLWQPFYPETDRHELPIPASAPGGVYTPVTGLYRYADQARLVVHDSNGVELGGQVALGPVKVVGAPPVVQPAAPQAVQFGDVARLRGYTLEAPTPLTPGATFTVTLFYDAAGPAPLDYTQFLHLYDPALGMAAQRDQQPLQGGNPTTAWVAGETIVEPIVLTVAEDAAPGVYRLLLGWYDAQANFARIPLRDGEGAPLADNQTVLVEITLGP
jgi:hypothetical protein